MGFSRTKENVIALYSKKEIRRFGFLDKVTMNKFLLMFSQVITEESRNLPLYIPTAFVNFTNFISRK